MQKLTYSALFLVAVFAVLWTSLSDDQATLHESNNDVTRPLEASKISVISPNIDNKKKQNHSEPSVVSISVPNNFNCSELCLDSLELLSFDVRLTDDEYEKLLGRTEALATYLRKNPDARAEFIELSNSEDSDKRSVIMAIFSRLDMNARRSLGEVLIESSDWHSRFDGIVFLAQPDIIDNQLVQRYSDMLATDPNYYVRSNIIKALNQPDKFYGNQEVLDVLEQVEYSDQDNTVRGEALLARVHLEHEPETVFHDVFSAIRSNEADYQRYGLRAFKQIVARQSADNLEIGWAYKDEAKYLFEELMTPEYDKMPEDLLEIAEDLYQQHF